MLTERDKEMFLQGVSCALACHNVSVPASALFQARLAKALNYWSPNFGSTIPAGREILTELVDGGFFNGNE